MAGFPEDPTCQFHWCIEEHFSAQGFPHRSCISRAGVPNVQGLIRSEMMIVIGIMLSVMREKTNQDITIVPVRTTLISEPL